MRDHPEPVHAGHNDGTSWGLKYPGLMRVRRFALLLLTGHRPSISRLSGFSQTLSSQSASALLVVRLDLF